LPLSIETIEKNQTTENLAVSWFANNVLKLSHGC
jgi:hypothetical protein